MAWLGGSVKYAKRLVLIALLAVLFAALVAGHAEPEDCGIPGTGPSECDIQSVESGNYLIEFWAEPSPAAVGEKVTLYVMVEDAVSREPVMDLPVDLQLITGQESLFFSMGMEADRYVYHHVFEQVGEYDARIDFHDGSQRHEAEFSLAVGARENAAQQVVPLLLGIGVLGLAGIAFLVFVKKAWSVGGGIQAVVALALVLGLAYFGLFFLESGAEKGITLEGKTCLHWHAYLDELSVCGEGKALPLESGDLAWVHTHKEKNKFHVHECIDPATVSFRESFTSVDAANWKVMDDCLGQWCDGAMTCNNGRTNSWKVFDAQGNEIENWRDHVWGDEEHYRFAYD